MVRSYKFAIVRLAPAGIRDERINVGLTVFDEDRVDVRLPRRLEKIRVLSAALDQDSVRSLAEAIEGRDLDFRASGISDPDARREGLGRVGPLIFSQLGTFTASNENEYERRLEAIFKSIIDPEPAPRTIREKRTRLVTQLKVALRAEKVLAKKDEDLNSHRVVTNWELAEGLVADFVLKNGAMHVIETVDASSGEASPRKTVMDIAMSALVLEQARINFGSYDTQAKLIYDASPVMEHAARPSLEAAAHQGAELVNWASLQDRTKFITHIAGLAIPIDTKNYPNIPNGGSRFKFG